MSEGTMPHEIAAVHKRVDDHEKQLGLMRGELGMLRGDVESLGRDMHNVQQVQTSQNGKLDEIIRAVATLQAHKPINSVEAIRNGITMTKDLLVMLGFLVATVIYLAGAVFNNDDSKVDLAVMKDRMERPAPDANVARIEERLRQLEQNRAWTPTIAPDRQ